MDNFFSKREKVGKMFLKILPKSYRTLTSSKDIRERERERVYKVFIKIYTLAQAR